MAPGEAGAIRLLAGQADSGGEAAAHDQGDGVDAETGLALPGLDVEDDRRAPAGGGGWAGFTLSRRCVARARGVLTCADVCHVPLFEAMRCRAVGAEPEDDEDEDDGTAAAGQAARAAGAAGATPRPRRAVAERGGGAWRITDDERAVSRWDRSGECLVRRRAERAAWPGKRGREPARYHGEEAAGAGQWRGRAFEAADTRRPEWVPARGEPMSAPLRDALGIGGCGGDDVMIGGSLLPENAPFVPRLRFRGPSPGWAPKNLTAVASGRLAAMVRSEKAHLDGSLSIVTEEQAADA